jgi:transposase
MEKKDFDLALSKYCITLLMIRRCTLASIIKKKKKNQVYYYLVESARVNGKPRIVRQKYLGRAEQIAAAMEGKGELDQPKHSIVLEFGAVMALYDLAKRLGAVDLINTVAVKRNQGLSIGDYMLIAAINRAIEPTSKHQIAEWFSKTTLDRVIPAKSSMLSSQRFWDNMSSLSEEAIRQFEDEFTRKIVQQYGLRLDCLIYDTTNFFTYVDTNSSSTLPQRGHSKEKRSDLKIVGLAMMVSPDFSVPLFHETYAGNHPDAKQFLSVIDRLKKRCQSICETSLTPTLVFDKGNNSSDHMKKLQSGEVKFRVVGSLKLSQCKLLLEVNKDKFVPLTGTKYQGVTAYRTTYDVYGQAMTVLVVYNPELEAGQLQGINKNIEQCTLKLNDLQNSLQAREDGTVKKGRKPTLESVQRHVDQILQKEFMKELFDVQVLKTESAIRMTFAFQMDRLESLKERQLGKTILYTDNHDWPDEKIISAYHSQYHIEEAFKQMKNTDHLGFRPIYHWTDQKIKVHAFYCVLALRLCALLNRELQDHGIDISMNRMLDVLGDIKQVITVYPKKGDSKKDRESFSLSKLSPEAKKIMEALGLDQYRLGR